MPAPAPGTGPGPGAGGTAPVGAGAGAGALGGLSRHAGGPAGHPGFALARDRLSEADAARRDAKQRLVDQGRALLEAIALLDAAAVDAGALDGLAQQAAALEQRLAGLPSHRASGLTSSGGWAATLNQRSPISGQQNPVAAPLHLESDGVTTFGHATYGAVYEGPAGCVHGGIVASAFDELLGVAQAASGSAGMTGTLTIRMRRPTPLHTRIDYEAGVERVEGRKIFAWGRSMANGEVVGEAEGILHRRPLNPKA